MSARLLNRTPVHVLATNHQTAVDDLEAALEAIGKRLAAVAFAQDHRIQVRDLLFRVVTEAEADLTLECALELNQRVTPPPGYSARKLGGGSMLVLEHQGPIADLPHLITQAKQALAARSLSARAGTLWYSVPFGWQVGDRPVCLQAPVREPPAQPVAPTPRILGLACTSFAAANPAALADWYTRVLGLVARAHDRGIDLTAPDGPLLLRVRPADPGAPPSPHPVGLFLTVDAVDAAATTLTAAGIANRRRQTDHGNVVQLTDPAGNRITLLPHGPS